MVRTVDGKLRCCATGELRLLFISSVDDEQPVFRGPSGRVPAPAGSAYTLAEAGQDLFLTIDQIEYLRKPPANGSSPGQIVASGLWALYVCLGDVALVPVPDVRQYEQVRLPRHTAHYALVLSICRLVHEEVLLTQEAGAHLLQDFVGNDKFMATLLERFVRNFYQQQ